MSENVISFGNTPLFDQLSQEFAARGRAYESLIAGGVTQLRPVGIQGVRAPYVAVDELPEVETKPQTDESVNAAANHAAPVVKTLREHFEKEAVIEPMIGIKGIMASLDNASKIDQNTIDIEKVSEPFVISYEEMAEAAEGLLHYKDTVPGFLEAQMKEFYKEHPGAKVTDITTEHQLDGSVKVVVQAVKPSFGGVSFSEAIAGMIQLGEHMTIAGKSVMDYYDEPEPKKTRLEQIEQYYKEGIASVNTLRRARLESNDSEPSVGRP